MEKIRQKLKKVQEKIYKKREMFIFIGMLFLLTLFSCAPILNPINIWAHDLSFHVNRIDGIVDGLKNGQFPAVINAKLINGMGYGTGLFYPDLFLYIPAILTIFGVQLLSAYKVFIVIITFITYLIMYYTIKKIFGSRKMAIVGSILYTLSLYRIEDVFIRAALGEILSFTFFPLIILGLYETIYGDRKKWYYITLGLFGIANSHMISFLFAVCVILLIMLLNCKKLYKEKQRFWELAFCGVISIWICASAFFPMFEQMNSEEYNVSVGSTGLNLSDMSAVLTKTFENTLHTGQASDTNNKISGTMNMGIGTILLIVPLCIVFCKNTDKNKKFVYQLLVVGFLAVIMTTKLFPWGFLQEYAKNIQFPWRINMVATLALSIVSAYVIYNISEYKKELCILTSILFIIFSGMQLEKSTVYMEDWTLDDLLEELPLGSKEYIPVNFKYDKDVANQITSQDGKKIYDYIREKNQIKFEYNSSNKNEEGKIKMPLIFYKGYTAKIKKDDGTIKKLNVVSSDNGTVLIENIDQEYGIIIVSYQTTIIQVISRIITIIVLIGIICYIIYLKKQNILGRNEKINDKNIGNSIML